jgi:hypothetical protein
MISQNVTGVGSPGHWRDVPVVDAVTAQRRVHEPSERILASPGDDRRAPPVPGRGHGDIGRAAAKPFTGSSNLTGMRLPPDCSG